MTTQLDHRLESGYRAVPAAEIHDVDDAKHLVAVDFPIVIDTYRTDFGPRCFEDGFRRRLPAMHIDHNKRARIGDAISGQSLSDRHRLVGRFDDSPRARHAFDGVRDGVYPGFSFHYIDGKTIAHPSGQRSALRFTKATMLEFGPVWAPSIPGTAVVGLRSDDDDLAALHNELSLMLAHRQPGDEAELNELFRKLGAATHARSGLRDDEPGNTAADLAHTDALQSLVFAIRRGAGPKEVARLQAALGAAAHHAYVASHARSAHKLRDEILEIGRDNGLIPDDETAQLRYIADWVKGTQREKTIAATLQKLDASAGYRSERHSHERERLVQLHLAKHGRNRR